eukprot:GEMP01000126.1.p1 GENE.GEMP01000126.1~~GEMP01000126.1.p1  ORF type:complete len:2845 (+),score=758.62 GEMP01000126.1:879-8537(+)
MQTFHDSMMQHAEQAERDTQTKANKDRFLYKHNSGEMSDQIRKRVVTRRQRVAEKLESAVNQRAEEVRRMEETQEYRRLMGIDETAELPLSSIGFSPTSSPSGSPRSLSPTISPSLAHRRSPNKISRAIDKIASLKDAARTVTKRLHEQYAAERTHISMAKVLSAQLEKCIEEKEKTQLTADIARNAKMRMLERERTMLYSSLNSRTTDVTWELNACRLACGLAEEAGSAHFAKKKSPTTGGSRSQRIRHRELTEHLTGLQGKLQAQEDELNALFIGNSSEGTTKAGPWVTVDVNMGTAQWLAPLLEAKPRDGGKFEELDDETSSARGEEVILLRDDIYRTRMKKEELEQLAARCKEEAHKNRAKRELLGDLVAVQKEQVHRITEIVRLQKQKTSNKLLVKELATEIKHKKHLQKLFVRSKRNGAQSKTQLHEFLLHVSTINRFLLRRRGKYYRTFHATLRTCGYAEEARKIGTIPWQLSRERATKYGEDLKSLRERLRGLIRMLNFWRKRIDQLEQDQHCMTDDNTGGTGRKVISDRLAYERGGRPQLEFMQNSARQRVLGPSMSFHAVFHDALTHLERLTQDPNTHAIAGDATMGHGSSWERVNAFGSSMATKGQMHNGTLMFSGKTQSDRIKWSAKLHQKMAGFVRRKTIVVPAITVTDAPSSLRVREIGRNSELDELELMRRKSMLARASRYSVFNFLSDPSRDGTDVQKAIAALKGHQGSPTQATSFGIHGQSLGDGLSVPPKVALKSSREEEEQEEGTGSGCKSHIAVVNFGDVVPPLGEGKGTMEPKNLGRKGGFKSLRRRQSVETKANAELNEWRRHLQASKRRADMRKSRRVRSDKGESSAGDNATSDETDAMSLASPIGKSKSSQPMLRQFLSDTTDGVRAAPNSPLMFSPRNEISDFQSDNGSPSLASSIKPSGSNSLFTPQRSGTPGLPQFPEPCSPAKSPKRRRDAPYTAEALQFDDDIKSSSDDQDDDEDAKDEGTKNKFEEVLDALRVVEPAAWQQLHDLQGVHHFTSEWRANVTSQNQAVVPRWVECVHDIPEPAIDESNVQVVTFYQLHMLALTLHSFLSIPRLLEQITVHVTTHPLRAVYVDVRLPGDATLRLMPYDVRQIQRAHRVKLSTAGEQDTDVDRMPTFEHREVVSEAQWTLRAMQVLRNIVLTEFGSFSKAYSEIPHIQTPHLGSPDTSLIMPATKPSSTEMNSGARDNLHRGSFERYLTLRANLTLREVGKLYEYVDKEGDAAHMDYNASSSPVTSPRHAASVLSRADFSEALRRAAPMRSVVQFRARLSQHEASKEQFWQQTLAHADLNAFCAAVEPWGVPAFDAAFVFQLLPHGNYERFELVLIYAEALTLCRHISSAGPRPWQEFGSLPQTGAVTVESLRAHLQLPTKDASILYDLVVFRLTRNGVTREPQVKDVEEVVHDSLGAMACATPRAPQQSHSPSPAPSSRPRVSIIVVDPGEVAAPSIATPTSATSTPVSTGSKRMSKTRVSFVFAGDSTDILSAPGSHTDSAQQYAIPKGTILRQKNRRDTRGSISVPRGSLPWLKADRVIGDPGYLALWQPADNAACKKQHARVILQKWRRRTEYDHAFATALYSLDNKMSLTKQLNAFADIKEITIVSDFLLNRYDDDDNGNDQPAHGKQQTKNRLPVATAVRQAVKLDTWEDLSRVILYDKLSNAPPELPFPLSAELLRDSLPIPWADARRLFELLWEGHDVAYRDESEHANTRRSQPHGSVPIFPNADTFCRAAQCADALAKLRACAECLESKYGSLDTALGKSPFPAERVMGKDDHAVLHQWAGMEVNMDHVTPKTIGALIYTLQSDPMTPFRAEHAHVRVGAAVAASGGTSDRPTRPRLSLLKVGGHSGGMRLLSPTMHRPDVILEEDASGVEPSARNIFISPASSRAPSPTSFPMKLSPWSHLSAASTTPNNSRLSHASSASKSLLSPYSVLPAVDGPHGVAGASPQPPGALKRGGLKVPPVARSRTHTPNLSQRSSPTVSGHSSPAGPMGRVSQRRNSHEANKLRSLLSMSEQHHQRQQPQHQSRPRSSATVFTGARQLQPHKMGEDHPMQPLSNTPRGDVLWKQRLLAFSGSVMEIQVAICRAQDLFDKIYPKWRQCFASAEGRVKLFQLLDARRDNVLDIVEIKAHVEKFQVSDGVWTVLDADRIFKVLNVGCTGAAEPTLTQRNFVDQLPVFVPVSTIPRLREHLIFMYGNLEDAFESFDVGPSPADEQFSIDEFETRLFPWSVCDRDARSIFRQLDVIHNTGHISLLLVLCAIEHAGSFALLGKKYPSSRMASMDVDEVVKIVTAGTANSEWDVRSGTLWSPSLDHGEDNRRAPTAIVTEDNFAHLRDLLWPADAGDDDDDDGALRSNHEEVLLALRVPLLCAGAKNAVLDVAQVVRVLRTWANVKGGRKKKRAPQQMSAAPKNIPLINAVALKSQQQLMGDVSSILVVPAGAVGDKPSRSPLPGEKNSTMMPPPSPQFGEKRHSAFVVPIFSVDGAGQSAFVPLDVGSQACTENKRSDVRGSRLGLPQRDLLGFSRKSLVMQ